MRANPREGDGMKAICVDGDEMTLSMAAAVCEKHPILSEVKRFSCARDALRWLESETVNLAVLDVELADVSGLLLASEIKRKCPACAVIFMANTEKYALDAFGLHASGYLLKPFHAKQLEAEVEYALTGSVSHVPCHIEVRTFGNFELLVDGATVSFNRSKAKELLAYLVDKQGSGVTRAEIFAVLWESGEYDRSMQKQVDVIIRSLRDTLEKNGVGEILELKRGSLRVRTEYIDCDLYRFLDGDPRAVNQFCGEYMSAYSWATFTEAHLEHKTYGGKK